jgi:hypothetical protein
MRFRNPEPTHWTAAVIDASALGSVAALVGRSEIREFTLAAFGQREHVISQRCASLPAEIAAIVVALEHDSCENCVWPRRAKRFHVLTASRSSVWRARTTLARMGTRSLRQRLSSCLRTPSSAASAALSQRWSAIHDLSCAPSITRRTLPGVSWAERKKSMHPRYSASVIPVARATADDRSRDPSRARDTAVTIRL